MAIVDCETQQSTLHTVAHFYNTTPLQVKQFLLETDESKIIRGYFKCCPFNEGLRKLFHQEFGEPVVEISEVCWFHLTRTPQSSDFRRGILPLNKAIIEIWDTLLTIFKDTEHHENLLSLREKGIPDYHYNVKVPDSIHWGPYAMLIRDIAFRPKEVGNHDYLWLPEIIEDICNGYLQVFKIQLHDIIVKSLKPCIVKFVSSKYLEHNLFTPILYYLFLSIKGESLSIDSNTCFDGEGLTVPAENILKVDFLTSSAS